MPYTRITVDPQRMGGLPCLRNLRIPVATVVAMVADGMSEQEILDAGGGWIRGNPRGS